MGLLAPPGFAVVALGGGAGHWFAVELQAAEVLEIGTGLWLKEDELLDVVFGCVGADASDAGLPQVVVPLRLKEPDFTRKEPPLSWEAVLMEEADKD